MLLETFNDKFEYEKLSKEEMESRGILGRLVGIIADTQNPTRNGRAYSEKLWNNVFNDPIMQEKIKNRCVFGELGHPTDRTETDMEKIAICLSEQPKKGKDGKLYGVFDILNTKCGQLLKTLCDYGCNIGISSRGEGDLITDYEGNESVDPETYSCECWDAVLIPAVKEARLEYVTESLGKKRYNKTLKESLQKTLESATEEDRKIMEETLKSLNISLDENINEQNEITDESIELDEMAAHRRFYYLVKLDGSNSATKLGLLTMESRLSNVDRDEIEQLARDGHPIKMLNKGNYDAKCLGMEYILKYKNRFDIAVYADLSLSDNVEDFDRNNIIFTRIKDKSEIKATDYRHTTIYVNGVLDEYYYDHGDTSFAEHALDNGDVVVRYTLENGRRMTPEHVKKDYLLKKNESMESDTLADVLTESLTKEQYILVELLQNLLRDGKSEEQLRQVLANFGTDADEIDTWMDLAHGGIVYDENGDKFKSNVENKLFNNDITDESLNINEDTNNEAVDNNEAIVEELQEALKAKANLESKLLSLQEKLSVCYAKEAKIDEEVEKYKTSIRRLSESARQAMALTAKVEALEAVVSQKEKNEVELTEKLSKVAEKNKEYTTYSKSLKEGIDNKAIEIERLKNSVSQLNEELNNVKRESEDTKKSLKESSAKELSTLKAQFNKEKATLTESITQLQEDAKKSKDEYSQKLERANKLVEKYKKSTNTAVDKYIELQAIRLGASKNEIKNRLPESYSFKDIDDICEDLQEYKLNMSKLPISAIARKSISENITIKGTSSKNESILPVSGFDDDIDADLMYLAGK